MIKSPFHGSTSNFFVAMTFLFVFFNHTPHFITEPIKTALSVNTPPLSPEVPSYSCLHVTCYHPTIYAYKCKG